MQSLAKGQMEDEMCYSGILLSGRLIKIFSCVNIVRKVGAVVNYYNEHFKSLDY